MKSKPHLRAKHKSQEIFRKHLRLAIEPLEQRSMLALVFPGTALQPPHLTYANILLQPGSLTYNATSDQFVMEAEPAGFKLTDSSSEVGVFSSTRSLKINMTVDAAGNLQPGGTLVVTGNIIGVASGTLLTGNIIAFGYLEAGATDRFDFLVQPTGGTLSSHYADKVIALRTDSENSSFNGTFTSNFHSLAKGNLGGLAPQIDLIKRTNGTDNNVGPGPEVPVGSVVTFTYEVKNTGQVPLSNISLVDDNGTPDDTLDDFHPTFIAGGDLNDNNRLDINETWLYTATRIATAGKYENFATVTGYVGLGTTKIEDKDVDHHEGKVKEKDPKPEISLVKLTNGTDNNVVTGPHIAAGDSVTWTYIVRNTGDTPLFDVVVIDDNGTPSIVGDNFQPVYVSGDANNDGVLDTTETWTFSATGVATSGQYENFAFVIARDLRGIGVTASDLDHYFGDDPAINVIKYVNDIDANSAPGVQVPVGSPLTFTYIVTNPGNVPLANVAVNDDVLGAVTSFTGDVGIIGLLEPGETWTYTKTSTAEAGQQTNIGTVTGEYEFTGQTLTANDPANYFGDAPAIQIVKFANGQDADTAPGVHVPVGSTVTFTYVVTNNGNVPLSNVAVNDDVLGAVTTFVGGDLNNNNLLDLTETWTFTKTTTALSGLNANVGTVIGNDPFTNETVTDDNPANYFGDVPAIQIVKYANGDDADSAPGVHVPAGSTVTFTYVVTNTGNVPLSNIVVNDNVIGLVTTFVGGDINNNGWLDLAETWTFTKSTTALAGVNTNIGTVTGKDAFTGDSVTDNNPANYFGDTPAIKIVKFVNGNDADVAPGIHVPVGSSLLFTYVVTNTGNVPLSNVAVNDNVLGPITNYVSGDVNNNALLDLTETWAFSKSATALIGPNANTGTVIGTDFFTGASVTSNNPANYFGNAPAITIQKTTNGTPNANPVTPDWDNEDAPNGVGVPALMPGSVVTWTYYVKNTGNVPYFQSEVVVRDDNGTAIATDDITPNRVVSSDVGNDGILSPGEVWYYSATGIVQNLSTPIGTATFNMSGNSALSGAAGNIRPFSAGGVSVNASAFSRDANGAWSTAYLGSYAGGLGVTDGSEGNGGNNEHTVDNVGRNNYVLFEFSENVVVDWAKLGYVVGGSDMTIWIGTKTNPFSSHLTLSDSLLTSLGFTEVNTGGSSVRTADFNAGQVSGNVLVIAARTGETNPTDRFKIEQLKVNRIQPGVYANKGTVTVPGAMDSDMSHYKNPATPPPPSGSISGTKYRDVSGNGLNLTASTYAPADVPLPGTTIYLDTNNNGNKDNGEPFKVTDADGNYSFTGLAAGTYYVREVVPSGFLRTAPTLTNGYTINLSSGASIADRDFANYETVCSGCTLSNVSYKLMHADGSSEVVTNLRGETKEGDVVTVTFNVSGTGTFPVTLVSYTAPDPFYDANRASMQEIYEVSTGVFSKGGLYTLTVSIPNSYYQVDFVCGYVIDQLGPAGSNIFYTPQGRLLSADNSGTHAPVANAASISGIKYNDLNGNGVKDSNEPGLKNWVVYIDANNNGKRDDSESASVTRDDGSYAISNLPAGTYTGKVKEVAQTGWTQTQTPGTLSLAAKESKTGLNFGSKTTTAGSVSGYKFNDRNADGEWDKNGLDNVLGNGDDEVALEGWKVFVDYDGDGIWDSNEPFAVTDSKGYYKITGVAAGVQAIDEVMKSGWVRTSDDQRVTVNSSSSVTNVNLGSFYGNVVMEGDTATVNFWKGPGGQALIKKLNDGGNNGTATKLGNWLASNFGEMYGTGIANLAGKTNAQVATYFGTLATNSSKQLEAQVLATVLAVYVTNSGWAGGTYACAYGFTVTTTGVRNDYYNIGDNGAAFGVVNDSALTVWDILVRTNARACDGVLWNNCTNAVKTLAKVVFTGINEAGEIG